MSNQNRPAKKSFDCVAFQRAQRKKLGKELEGLSSAEIAAWMRDYRPTDPILRRFMDRVERAERLRNRDAGAQNPSSPDHGLPA